MGFLDKAKAAAEQAASKAKEGVQDVQTKRELAQAYHELGQKTHELFASGALAHPELTALVDKITALKAQDEHAHHCGLPQHPCHLLPTTRCRGRRYGPYLSRDRAGQVARSTDSLDD